MEDALKKILKKHRVQAVDTSVLIYHFKDLLPYSLFTEPPFSALARGEAEVVTFWTKRCAGKTEEAGRPRAPT